MDMEDIGVESLDEILNILEQDVIAAYSELKKTKGKISSCDIVIAEYDDAKGEYEVFSEEGGKKKWIQK